MGTGGIVQACAIFRNNPEKAFRPIEIENRVNSSRDIDNLSKYATGSGRKWVERLKKRGIIKQTGKKYILDSDQKALSFLSDSSTKKGGPTPRGYEGYQVIQTPEGMRTVQRHLMRLIGNVTFPKETIDSWVSMGILKPKNPNDPELALEGYVVLSMDYIKSFRGRLKTFTFTPFLLPVNKHINSTFGKPNRPGLHS